MLSLWGIRLQHFYSNGLDGYDTSHIEVGEAAEFFVSISTNWFYLVGKCWKIREHIYKISRIGKSYD